MLRLVRCIEYIYALANICNMHWIHAYVSVYVMHKIYMPRLACEVLQWDSKAQIKNDNFDTKISSRLVWQNA